MILSENSSICTPPSQNVSKSVKCLGIGILLNMTMGHLSRKSINRTSPSIDDWEGLLSNGVK